MSAARFSSLNTIRNKSTAASACARRKIVVAKSAPILGVDVGEDFLDLALLLPDRATLSYHRVPLRDIKRQVVGSIATRIAELLNSNLKGGIALVDSPRAPRDVDCSSARMIRRMDAPRTRVIDASLRELLREKFEGKMRPLSMFPTPLAAYFAGCIAHSGCKPHLRAIAEELLAPMIAEPVFARDGVLAGGTFTRFMLAGFAVFPALERLGMRAFESYPDLQMRLWSDGVKLPPKRAGEALRVRQMICSRLAAAVEVANFRAPKTLDESDAAVLALSAAVSNLTGALIELCCPPEGRFAVAFKGGAHRA